MTITRNPTPKPLTENQKIALRKRKPAETIVYNPGSAKPGPATAAGNSNAEKQLDRSLNEYLVLYNARLIEIDHKYPLGHPDRPGWLEVHRKNCIRHVKEITQGKTK